MRVLFLYVLYSLIFPFSITRVNEGKDDDVADHRTSPRNCKAQDQIGVGWRNRINRSHPKGSKAKNPDNSIHGTPYGVSECLDRASEDGVNGGKDRGCRQQIIT